MWEWIIVVVLSGLLFGGGFWLGNTTAPKQINNNTYIDEKTYVETRQESVQNTMQGQVTAILQDGKKTEYLNINLNGATNLSITRSTNSNRIIITNGITSTN